jgi:hypothetical protein
MNKRKKRKRKVSLTKHFSNAAFKTLGNGTIMRAYLIGPVCDAELL